MKYHETVPSEMHGIYWSIGCLRDLRASGCIMQSDMPLLGPLPSTNDEAITLACEVQFARMCVANNTAPIKGECQHRYSLLAMRFLLDNERSLSLLRDMEKGTIELSQMS